ncbi:MAG TPA: glucan 1,4-alpha-glucosidase [Dissulfurispiraceae bacterium]
MGNGEHYAPGGPGIAPRWTSSAKTGVGTSLNPVSRVWFTLSHGIFNEIFYPRIDQACVRDMGFIVTSGGDFISEEKRDTDSRVEYIEEGVPAYRLINTCRKGRYRIEKEIITDPRRHVVLQRTRFIPLQGSLHDYRVYVLLSPHIDNHGSNNTAWIDGYKGVPMFFAARGAHTLGLACSATWNAMSVGFAGASDGWQDLHTDKRLTRTYTRAENGNVAVTGEIDLLQSGGDFTLALGFGTKEEEAGQRIRASLLDGFEIAKDEYLRLWTEWRKTLLPMEKTKGSRVHLYPISASLMRIHEAKDFPGGFIASLSIPWGFAKGDNDLGGYHLVWPRDLVETAGGLLATGSHGEFQRILRYLESTQEEDGHWSQNQWLDGTPYWSNVQMDETALPILLIELARREGALDSSDIARFWHMVQRAASYLVCNGPVTGQDRWEENPGYSPFTLSAEIAALLAAAEMADHTGKPGIASYLRETADAWNSSIERWIYVKGTGLAQEAGIGGYYVRIAEPEKPGASSPKHGFVPIKKRQPDMDMPAVQLLSPDFLALVRFGLRAPDDPRILDTIKVVDRYLKIDTPFGPAWHRYTGDQYGEHDDGTPYDGTGKGRAWPLLTGERAHYELAAGRRDEAERLLLALESFANESGLIPEQIWDTHDIPQHGLALGKPSGSAMPLVWAHAEHLKLKRSLHEGRIFDMPPQTVQRYIAGKTSSPYAIWRFNHKSRTLPEGKMLRIEVKAPAMVRWSADGWKSVHGSNTRDTGLGMHIADLPTTRLAQGSSVIFTFYWLQSHNWENKNFTMQVQR